MRFQRNRILIPLKQVEKLLEILSKIYVLVSKIDSYLKTNERVEKLCKIGYFVMAKLTPICWILPKAVISYSLYFVTNAGNEAFDLPLLAW